MPPHRAFRQFAYCQGVLLRNEIEARDAGKLQAATDYAAAAIAERHGTGEVAAKIQAYVIVAVAEGLEYLFDTASGQLSRRLGQVRLRVLLP